MQNVIDDIHRNGSDDASMVVVALFIMIVIPTCTIIITMIRNNS